MIIKQIDVQSRSQRVKNSYEYDVIYGADVLTFVSKYRYNLKRFRNYIVHKEKPKFDKPLDIEAFFRGQINVSANSLETYKCE